MQPRSSHIEPTPKTGSRLDGYSAPRPALTMAAIAVVAIALLAPALGGPFLWDDELLIPNNAAIHSFAHWADWFRSSLFAEPEGNAEVIRYWRPLALFSFALEWHLVGENPALYHATNIVLYLVLVLFVGHTLRRYTASPVAATVATALFALHPTHAECAAWISGRMDILVAIGILGCCWALGERLRQRPGAIWLEIGFAGIAYMSKETALSLPAFCFVEAWFALGAPKPSRPVFKRLGRALAPQVVLALGYAISRWLWLPMGNMPGKNEAKLGVGQRLEVFFETLGRDGVLTLWPLPQRAQHGLVSLTKFGSLEFNVAYVAIGIALVAALFYLLVVFRRRPLPLFATALIAFSLLPASNLLSPWLLSCFTFERYLLLPHVAGAWCVAIAVDAFERRTVRRNAPGLLVTFGLVATLVAATFGWRLQCRATDYSDADRFWRHELRVNPDSSVAPSSLSALSQVTSARLDWLRLCHTNASKRGQSRDADSCLISASETLMSVLLDAQVDELEQLKQIWKLSLRSNQSENLKVAPIVRGVSLPFPLDAVRRRQIRSSYPGRIEAALALLHSRLGQHREALLLAEDSLSLCQRCRWTAPLATVFAAAGQHQRAVELLIGREAGEPDALRVRQQVIASAEFYRRAQLTTGAQHLHDLSQSFLSIGRFGLAFATLQPEEAAILGVPEAAIDYAHIAHRAGHIELAQRVLLHHLQPTEVETLLRAWSIERRQVD